MLACTSCCDQVLLLLGPHLWTHPLKVRVSLYECASVCVCACVCVCLCVIVLVCEWFVHLGAQGCVSLLSINVGHTTARRAAFAGLLWAPVPRPGVSTSYLFVAAQMVHRAGQPLVGGRQ